MVLGGPVREPRHRQERNPDLREKRAEPRAPAEGVGEDQTPLPMTPAANLGLEVHGLEMRPKRFQRRRRRQRNPAVVAVLAVLDAPTLFRPRPLHVNPAVGPIDVRAIEGHRLAPTPPGYLAALRGT